MRLSQQSLEQLNRQYSGQRIEFLDEKGQRHACLCDYFTYNRFESWGLVCLAKCRTPTSNVRVETIKIKQ